MSIPTILQRILLPGEVLAKKTAAQIVAHPKMAADGIRGLLQHIDNTCRPCGLGCSELPSLRAKSMLENFCADRTASPTLPEALQLVRNLKLIKRDFERQVPGAMRMAGRGPSWYRDRANEAQRTANLARSLQHFRGPASPR